MDIADKRQDRERAAGGFGGTCSAASVPRFLLGVFATFLLADAVVTNLVTSWSLTVLPRFSLPVHEQASAVAGQRRCHYGTQASSCVPVPSLPPGPVLALSTAYVTVCPGHGNHAVLHASLQPYYFEALAGNFSELPERWRLHAHDPECELRPMAEQLANGSGDGPFADRLVAILYGDR